MAFKAFAGCLEHAIQKTEGDMAGNPRDWPGFVVVASSIPARRLPRFKKRRARRMKTLLTALLSMLTVCAVHAEVAGSSKTIEVELGEKRTMRFERISPKSMGIPWLER